MENISVKLSDPSLLENRGYIAGEWVDCDTKFDVTNPATGDIIAQVADLGMADIKRAIDKAYDAKKQWAAKTAKQRCDILLKWHGLLVDNADDLAHILTAEMGKPFAEARGEIIYGASFIEWFAQEGRRVYGDTIPGHQPDKRIMVLRQPVGVVASITPWNFPNAMIARKVAPALAAGCTFVARPAELTPLSAIAMAVLAERAGIPKGVFSVVPNSIASATGKEFCSNKKVRKITFTGSTRVGSILMRQCADDIKKLSLELGGNAPFIVFNDADIDKAVEGAIIAKFRNTGQTCVCANRIYAQAGVYEEFSKKLAIAVSKLKIGNGNQDGVQIGPIINQAGIDKIEQHLADAVNLGGKILVGGNKSNQGALFFEPTVIINATKEMQVTNEETFGPLAPVYKFDDVDEVIELANDTDFGLASYFYSNNLSQVYKVAEALEYGMVGVNTGLISTAEAPFGGIKQSGIGREGSKYGIEDYLELKYICLSV